MSKKLKYGKCKLCGEVTQLTFEHVPPNKAFNSQRVKRFGSDEVIKLMAGADGRLPWDYSGLKGEFQQKGSGDYYLCRKCNNNTGSWYMRDYIVFANTMALVQQNFNSKGIKNCNFWIDDIYPLRIFKAIMTMFCDINFSCFGDEKLRQFLMNKENNDFDTKKYTVSMYLNGTTSSRMLGINAVHVNGIGTLVLSEVSHFPLGFLLYIDKPEGFKPPGIVINDFAKIKYNDKQKTSFWGLPIYEINTNFPADFRTKNEIKDCINHNRIEMEKRFNGLK